MPTAVTKDQITERVIEALVSFGAERDEVTLDAEFEAIDIDSLDLVELAQVMEDEYEVRISEEDMNDLKTVGQAIDLIAARASG